MANEKVKVVLSVDSYVGKNLCKAGDTVEVAAEIAVAFGEVVGVPADDSDQTGAGGDDSPEEA